MANKTNPRQINDGGLDELPSYHEERCCRIGAALARLDNASDADIAEALDVSVSALNRWRDRHPKFAEALKSPPSNNDYAIARALLRSALGYDYKTDKVIDTREGPVVRSVKVHSPPSVEALEFLLRARMPKVYGLNAKAAKGSTSGIVEAMQKRVAAGRADLERRKAALKAGLAEPEPTDEETAQLINDETCMVSHVMARLYASDDEIAEALDISADKFKELRDRHVELAEAIKSGKEFIDAALERALTQRALGHEYVQEDILCSREGDIVRTSVLKHTPADRKAQDLWGWALEVRAESSAGKGTKGSS